MKLNKSGHILVVVLASLAVAISLSACSQLNSTLTADFVFVTSSKAAGPYSYGEINVFEVNSQSGRMRQIPTSPFPSGGRNPVAEAVSTDNTNLYVVNRDDNTIVRFVIGNDGKVYPQQTVNTPGIFPLGVAVSGSNLFVADTYQPLPACSPSAPCSGSIAALPIAAAPSGSAAATCGGVDGLCTGVPINTCNGLDYLPLALTGGAAGHIVQPTAIGAAAKGGNLFVTALDTTTRAGYLFGYSVSTLACPSNPSQSQTIAVLTPLTGSPWAAGTQPSSITEDPSGAYVYVTDFAGADVLGYAVNGSTLTSLGTFPAGNQPASIVVSASGKFAYVANSLDSNVTGYSISNGMLTSIGTFAAGSQPVAVGIDPKLEQYVFTANFLGNTVSGFQMNSGTGALLNSQFSPFTSDANPTAVAAIPHK